MGQWLPGAGALGGNEEEVQCVQGFFGGDEMF